MSSPVTAIKTLSRGRESTVGRHWHRLLLRPGDHSAILLAAPLRTDPRKLAINILGFTMSKHSNAPKQPFVDLQLSGDESYDSAAPHPEIEHATVRKWAPKPVAIIQIRLKRFMSLFFKFLLPKVDAHFRETCLSYTGVHRPDQILMPVDASNRWTDSSGQNSLIVCPGVKVRRSVVRAQIRLPATSAKI